MSFGAIDRSKGLDIIISVPESHRVALFSYDSESGKFSYQRNFLVRNNSLNLADLNSDGKPDLIFHDPASQQLKWADHQSLSEEGVGSASPLDTFWYPQRKYPVSVDLDQDNDLDFVFARDSSIWWLENRDGKGGKWLSEEIWTESRKIRNLYVQDFDRDGNLDILYTDAKSYCYLLTQIDSVKRLTFGKSKRLVDMSTGNPGNMAIGDYNKDGSLDFVSSSGRKNFLAFFKCSWLGGCLYPRYIGEGIKEARPLYILDFDQDGQNEVLGIESPEGKVFIVRQGQPVDYLIENERVMDLVVEDLDQDGDLDLLCGYQNIFWFENTDGFLLKHEISTKEWRAGYAYKVLYLDFNKDGKKDVITFRTTGEITLNLGLR
ncbi:MAG: VCBS repeat-containing protein [Cyanothece sp. SIO1E1]|nr:VCBS repeat-containing protein [Cyanothece sp. SIO1E1]